MFVLNGEEEDGLGAFWGTGNSRLQFKLSQVQFSKSTGIRGAAPILNCTKIRGASKLKVRQTQQTL